MTRARCVPSRSFVATGFAAAALLVVTTGSDLGQADGLGADGREPRPADAGLVEHVTSRLQQIDLSLMGPAETLQSLTREDLDLTVGGKSIADFFLDRVCQESSDRRDSPQQERVVAASKPGSRSARPHGATYVFYFDQPHLTLAGRATAIDTAKELAPPLLRGGALVMIVSNASKLTTYLKFTASASEVISALERLKSDVQEFDSYAAEEEGRISAVLSALNHDGTLAALTMAKRFRYEERWRQERDLRRLELVLGRLADLDPPKAVLYFADTMRANPGEHYLSFLSGSVQRGDSGRLNLDRVIGEADAFAVRFYTVEAAGLHTDSLRLSSRMTSAIRNAPPSANNRSFVDAEDTLSTLALETGGRAFLNGVSTGKIARGVLDDLSCIHLLSFDPRQLPKDRPLSIEVGIRRPGVKARVRRQLVVMADETRRAARLLASFAAPEAIQSDVPLRVAVIPTGFNGGSFRGRVQVSVPPLPLPDAVWDLGASLVSHGRVTQETSVRAATHATGVPVVLESDMTFAPGPYEIIAVAHETMSDQIASKQVEGRWPTPDEASTVIGPMAVLQPFVAAFVNGDRKRTTGELVLGEADPVLPDRPIAILGVVCRAGDQKQALTVNRMLVGDREIRLEPVSIPYEESDRCAQFRDLIPANTLGEGRYRYVVRVSDGTGTLAEKERGFVVAATP